MNMVEREAGFGVPNTYRLADEDFVIPTSSPFPQEKTAGVTRQQYASSRARLEHAYLYLRKDRDAQHEISLALARQRVDFHQQFGKVRNHRCQHCEEYEFQGSERPGMTQTRVQTVRCNHSENGYRCMLEAGHDEPTFPIRCGPATPGTRHSLSTSMERLPGPKLEIHSPSVPPELLEALAKMVLVYTGEASTLYYFCWLGKHSACGVFGYGANGTYEWFIWEKGKVRTSDMGYGSPEFCLKEVLGMVEL